MDDTKKIRFSGIFLSVDDEPINIDNFKETIIEGRYNITEESRVHIYQYEYEEDFLKITLGDGSAMPRNPIVFNIETNEEEENPRQADQIEPREAFGLIDFKTGMFWLSNSRKKKYIVNFFRSKFPDNNIIAKDVYEEETFIRTLKRLDDIRLSATPNLFSNTHSLTEYLTDEINGYEASIAHLHFHYQDKFVGENLIQKIRTIFANKSNFNGIVISGRDERNLGMLFNSDGFSRKIEFKARIDENEMFLTDDVFTKLITNIQDENH